MLTDADRTRIRKSFKSGNSLEYIAQVEGLHVAMVQTVVGKQAVMVKDPEEIAQVLEGIELHADMQKYSPNIRTQIKDIWDGAAVAGIDAPVYIRTRLGRCLALLMGGMSLHTACLRSGIGKDGLGHLATAFPVIQELVEASIFVADMRALDGLAKAQRAGDVKAVLVQLERQTGDFAPAQKTVNVGSVDLRAGWGKVSQVLEGEVVSKSENR